MSSNDQAQQTSTLKEIWMELLEVEQVAVDDNFIEKGGNSLLATILVARFEEATGVGLELQHIFEMNYGELILTSGLA
jgi:acyl carrier protein